MTNAMQPANGSLPHLVMMASMIEGRDTGKESLLALDSTVSHTLKFLAPELSLLDMHSFCLYIALSRTLLFIFSLSRERILHE